MKNPRTLLTVLTSIGATAAMAQPHAFGCHYFRDQPGPLTFTAASREQIEETIARSDTFDIIHYDIALDLSTYLASAFKAVTTITFAARMEDLDHIRFDLFALTVDSVKEGNGLLPFTSDGVFLDVQLGVPAAIGEERSITVHYRGTPHRDPEWGGFYYTGGYMYNLGIGISTIPPNFGKVWYPCFDSFVERATYAYHVKTTGTYRFHGQGEMTAQIQLGGDTIVRSFALDDPIPTHVSAVAVAAYVDSDYVHTGLHGDIPVRLTARNADMATMVQRFGQLGSTIDACEHWYGPHPYDRIGYVITTDGALEIPTNIAYPRFMLEQSISENRQLFAHELGHHWWGDHVTPHIHNEMWLKEGPAEYSGHLVDEWLYGRQEFIKTVKDNHLFVLRSAHRNDGGFQPMSPMPDPYIYGTHTYNKGASVMHNLRGYLGDEAFRQALTGVQVSLAERTMTSDGFKNALEEHAGVDLDPFFDAWVFAPGFSVFEVRAVETTPVDDGWLVGVDVGQKLRGTTTLHDEVPLDITFIGANGSVHEQQITAGGSTTPLEFHVPFEPVMTVLNRGNRLNQARMDNEVVLVPGVTFTNNLPYVDFRLYADTLVDSTLVRIEHIWSEADQQPLAEGVQAVSGTHYWNVDGLWPEGTVLNARVYYNGEQPHELDYELVGFDEQGMTLLHRSSPQHEWSIYTDQTMAMGNTTNGSGSIAITRLRKGQYAFGRANAFIGMEDRADRQMRLELGPIPAQDHLVLRGEFDGATRLHADILGVDGRILQRELLPVAAMFEQRIGVASLASGSYVLRISDPRGSFSEERRFEVVR